MSGITVSIPYYIYIINPAIVESNAVLLFDYSAGFANAGSNVKTTSDAASISNGILYVTNNNTPGHQSGSGFYHQPVNITAFTTKFTFQLPSGLAIPSISGISFCIENSNGADPTFGPVGDANLCGFGSYTSQNNFTQSVEIKFDLNAENSSYFTYPTGGTPSTTGLYINGGPQNVLSSQNDLNPYGINLYNGNVFSCIIVYDGSLLTMTLTDTTGIAQAKFIWPINISNWVTGNTANVGFTGGTIPSISSGILEWSYWSGYNTRLPTPTFSPTPGEYGSTQTVTISGPMGATIYYTTNGLLPTSSSTEYTSGITVGNNEVIQAVAVQSGYTDSYVSIANYQIGTSNVINFPSGFSTQNGLVFCGYTSLINNSIQLTDTTNDSGEVSAIWFGAPVDITSFNTSFTLQLSSNNVGSGYGLGTVFCVQNQPNTIALPSENGCVSGGPSSLGTTGSALGYGYLTGRTDTTGGLLESIGIKFDLFDNSTGLYIDGVQPTTPNTYISGITLSQGHPLIIEITYDGTSINLSITDTVTSNTFNTSWTENISSIVGANTAYVGFTAATGYFSGMQSINNWTFAR